MRATLICGAGDVRVEDVPDPVLLEPTDAIVARLDDLPPAAGDHHGEERMRMIER
ncbi:hypothetical protein GCM10010149_24950 [Nonomuraea roseoviolacea subsp. roseoviolacea]|uniref:hypothetical protein n=1 Tax=Nonomuraea roseoviolacea TaxID=103837 RepID=UPI0031DBA7D6